MDDDDPVVSNPDHYALLWENDRVRVLEYRDAPGDETTPHHHPDSVMVTLTSFSRRLDAGGRSRDVTLAAEQAVWLPEQSHTGRNTGDSPTHTIIVELKESSPHPQADGDALGPEHT
ncbi:cytoplasmic protein [Leifsonia sp. NPDC080035]|uniref:Cytoplasmic protein n=1 Tax=Leifsonia sp. NPDC080035 TaxID=3143936 RepID=A0AAU7GE18_9MICO